jgi:acetyl esterase
VTLPPQIQQLIDWERELGERYAGLAIPDLRVAIARELRTMLSARGMRPPVVASISEHELAVKNGLIRLRLYHPHGEAPHPVFVHLHGGGFMYGSIDDLNTEAKCAYICHRAGCAVATVEYRLAPEHRYPTAPEDCYAALEWVAREAVGLGLDGNRIAIGGESAGASLAASVALMARDRNGPQLTMQLLEVPVVDVTAAYDAAPSVGLYAEGYGLDRAAMDSIIAAYLEPGSDGTDAYASPVRAKDLSNVAPAYVMTAEYDILRDSGEAYARRLIEAGVPTTTHRLLGHTHGSALLWQWWGPARSWMDEVAEAASGALARERSADVVCPRP